MQCFLDPVYRKSQRLLQLMLRRPLISTTTASILVVRFDQNPRNNMSAGDIARAARDLESNGVAIADSNFELNHWP
jgi:hypothetical protein